MLRAGLAIVSLLIGSTSLAAMQAETCVADKAAAEGRWWQGAASIMGTEIHVELWHTDAVLACEAVADVMAEMHRIDEAMSPYIETSLLSQLNIKGADGFVDVGAELFGLINRSQGYAILTGGAFDVTYASAGRYYDYRKGQKPDPDTLRVAVEAINYRHLELDHRNHAIRFHHEHLYVDLGGIAKGHAVDRAIKILRDLGVEQAMVSAGGDSRILGDRLGEPWVVGVRDPRNANAQIVVLPLMNASVSTSGDYERFFEEDGVRYHHIIDPKSGDSARSVMSVTIIGAETTATDALSTSVFVMGVDKGIALIDRLIGIDAIVVDGAGNVHTSEGLMPMAPANQSNHPEVADLSYKKDAL
ncbi:MAG: thiamine biosynthesis lipoprotein [Candidatus Azotimanducaceae bacterium]|jgi:thiamine biosynthesis lipoprotein